MIVAVRKQRLRARVRSSFRLAASRRPLAALSATPRQLIRYRFGLPPCQGAPGGGSLIESPISHTLFSGSSNRTVRLAVPGWRLASSLPVHRRAMDGYPGSSVDAQYLRRLPPQPRDARTPTSFLGPCPYCRSLLLRLLFPLNDPVVFSWQDSGPGGMACLPDLCQPICGRRTRGRVTRQCRGRYYVVPMAVARSRG